MKTLLRIDSSARNTGSHSRELAQYFEARWQVSNPGGKVIRRDLAGEPPPHLNAATLGDFFAGKSEPTSPGSHVDLSEVLIEELLCADDLLISSSLYNFGIPSSLKAYIDHIVRAGRTFQVDAEGFRGLLNEKTAFVITAQGGFGDDYLGPHLQTTLQFLGIERREWIALEGTTNPDGKLDERVALAKASIDRWFGSSEAPLPADEIEWSGVFSLRDRAEITELRSAQTRAILAGDAAAYAALCDENIMLLLQGRDLVQGRSALEECERELLAKTRFAEMRQFPIRVERHGQMAVEIGRQEISTASGEDASFKARRKYSHVLRQTPSGWRFAVLMSNNSM